MSVQFELFQSDKITKYSFSGHANFHCRILWLKKAYDFLDQGNKFNNTEAFLKLGVGSSMIASIKFWCISFGIIDKNENISQLGKFLFSDDGVDPFLEDINSLWLLHFHLIYENKASIYSIFFNHIKKGDREYSCEKIKKELNCFVSKNKQKIPSDIVLENDIQVFKRTYLQTTKSENIEDDFIGLLHDLNLFKTNPRNKIIVESLDRNSISEEVFFYAILTRFKGRKSISVEEIFLGENSPGFTFCMSENAVLSKLKAIVEKIPKIVLSENSGVRELQLLKDFDKFEILNNYYY
jgi:hypothetical protein